MEIQEEIHHQLMPDDWFIIVNDKENLYGVDEKAKGQYYHNVNKDIERIKKQIRALGGNPENLGKMPESAYPTQKTSYEDLSDLDKAWRDYWSIGFYRNRYFPDYKSLDMKVNRVEGNKLFCFCWEDEREGRQPTSIVIDATKIDYKRIQRKD